MCKGGGDRVPVPVVQQALDDNLYLSYFSLMQRKPADYQPDPKPHPKPKPWAPGPPGFHVPDLDI